MNPIVVDNFLPQGLFTDLLAASVKWPLSYGSKSNSKSDPHGHLSYKPVYDNQQNLADIAGFRELPPDFLRSWQHVEQRARNGDGRKMRLVRAYVNAYSYGMDGYAHTDSTREGELTFIIYLCDRWEDDWGGETLAWRGETIWTARPKPNRCLVLPSNMLHRASAVSRKYNGLRTVLVLKARPQRDGDFERLSVFLVRHGALRHDHQQGSLHDHLVRVYQLLRDRKLDTAVCLGGGLHSIYGTNAFKHRLLDATESSRAAVAGEFGREAEHLADMFSILDRPRALEAADLAAPNYSLQLIHSAEIFCSQKTLRELCAIECANLADQGGLSKWPRLEKFWHGMGIQAPTPAA